MRLFPVHCRFIDGLQFLMASASRIESFVMFGSWCRIIVFSTFSLLCLVRHLFSIGRVLVHQNYQQIILTYRLYQQAQVQKPFLLY